MKQQDKNSCAHRIAWAYKTSEKLKLSLPEASTLALLAFQAGPASAGKAFSGMQTIANKIGTTRRTVIKAIAELEKKGVIIRTKRPGRVCFYYLQMESDTAATKPKRAKKTEKRKQQSAKQKTNIRGEVGNQSIQQIYSVIQGMHIPSKQPQTEQNNTGKII